MLEPASELTTRQRRGLLLKLVRKRIQPGAGSSSEFLQRRTALNPWPDLREPLEDVDWLVIGGVATRAFMPERSTKDLDILVRASDGESVLQCLKNAGFSVVTELGVPGYLVNSPDGADIDVVFGEQPWLEEAFRNPVQDPAGFPVADLPYLVLSKLQASRSQDVADLARMLGWADDETLERVRQAVITYAPEDLDDLETLIFLGRQERGESA